jgi:hypothetical protein
MTVEHTLQASTPLQANKVNQSAASDMITLAKTIANESAALVEMAHSRLQDYMMQGVDVKSMDIKATIEQRPYSPYFEEMRNFLMATRQRIADIDEMIRKLEL